MANLPEALSNGRRLRGKVRQEFSTIEPGILSMGTSEGAERGEDVEPYPVLDRATATLTAREHEPDARVAVPDAEWELADARMENGKLTLTPSPNHIYVKGGFKPGWLYELIYETEGSRVMGLGFLGIRDLVSFLRFGDKDSLGAANPLAGYFERAYATGTSLSGRVAREYIYEGWNEDAEGRRLFDAMHTHTGSGRLLHNIRFSQPGRYPRQHEEHTWPAEYYPFSFDAVPDTFSAKRDGLWKRPKSDPLVVHTHTEGGYWKRHVSLTHTDPRDGNDLALPANVRMYNFTGIRFPEVEVPLGTCNGWALRKAGFAEGAEFWNTGSFVPFARTRAEREARGDPRASIEERYTSFEDYVQKVQRSCDELVKRRLLLEEDARMLVERARSRNPLDPAVPLGPLVPVLVAPGG